MSRSAFLEKYLNQFFDKTEFEFFPLNGDASFRRYFRVNTSQQSYVLMDAPAPENPQLFISMAALLQKHDLTVPKIIDADLNQGFILLQDFGDRLYLNELNENTCSALYQDAFKALDLLQAISTVDLPCFDQEFLNRQYGFFVDWYLHQHLNVTLSSSELNNLTKEFNRISEVVLSQPQVFVHRDYHSRNLMILEKNNPGILDFQDAMCGPITYDVVSLLQDCYITWPRTLSETYLRQFLERKKQQGQVDHRLSEETFLKWFDYTGLQRHLKNLGIFARLKYRDNKTHYVKDMKRPFSYSMEITAGYPELEKLHEFLLSIQAQQDFMQNQDSDIKGNLSCVR